MHTLLFANLKKLEMCYLPISNYSHYYNSVSAITYQSTNSSWAGEQKNYWVVESEGTLGLHYRKHYGGYTVVKKAIVYEEPYFIPICATCMIFSQ
jgi:hypothetical protein